MMTCATAEVMIAAETTALSPSRKIFQPARSICTISPGRSASCAGSTAARLLRSMRYSVRETFPAFSVKRVTFTSFMFPSLVAPPARASRFTRSMEGEIS